MLSRLVPRSREERVVLLVLGALLVAGGILRLLFMIAWRPAFAGYPDAGVYVNAAAGNLFGDPFRPAGYPVFLRLLHGVWPNLSFAILVQHLLGMATAVLLFMAVRRARGPAWLGAIPAAVVLLSGGQVFLEHSPLSEALFSFLVAASLYAAACSLDRLRPQVTLFVGLLPALAGTVRLIGLGLVPVFGLWLLFGPLAPFRRRLLHAVLALAVAAVLVAGYLDAQESRTGYLGLARAGSWNLYGRVARFADCSRFTPPPGTRPLCQHEPESRRRMNPEAYIFDTARSPAVRTFGVPFFASQEANDEVGRFARAALVHQPLDYLETVAKAMRGYVVPGLPSLGEGDPYDRFFRTTLFNPTFSRQLRQGPLRWYGPAAERVHEKPGLLHRLWDWEAATRIQGPVAVLLGLLSLLSPLVNRGPNRRLAFLLLGVAWALLVLPVATHWWDARQALPAFGPLAASATLGGLGLAQLTSTLARHRSAAPERTAA